MRILFFFIVSASVHLLAARWIVSAFPKARARSRRIYAITGAIAILHALIRVSGLIFKTAVFHDLIGVTMLELAVVAVTLPWLGFFLLASRATSVALGVVKSPKTDDDRDARIGRRQAIERFAGVGIAGATTVTLGWGAVRGRHAFQLEEVVVKIPNWPKALEGYTIAQVSDIHVGAFVGDRELDEGFELVKRIRPDLLVATGDLVDFQAEAIHPLLRRLSGAGARDGAFAILGNHDHYADADAIGESIRKSSSSPGGVILLDNEHRRIRPNDGGGFALIGVDDLQGRRGWSSGHKGPDLDRALRNLAPQVDLPRILLAHQPQYFNQSKASVALQLSGHTHGGQINPGFRPASALMEFVAGRYEREGSTLWVNRGFGVASLPSRVGAPPEVTKIVIVSG